MNQLDNPIDVEPIDTQEQEDFFEPDLGVDSGGYGGVSTMEKHNDLLKELTNFDPFIKETINGWLGIVWDDIKKEYVQDQNLKPIMNRAGAMWCVTFLRKYARSNNIITNISEREYAFIMSDVLEVIWFNIGLRKHDFGIKSNNDVFRVCNELEHTVALVLMGAGDGKYNQLLSTTTNRNESVSLNDQRNMRQMQQPQRGFFGKAKNFLLGKNNELNQPQGGNYYG